jgi:hypothetical protein
MNGWVALMTKSGGAIRSACPDWEGTGKDVDFCEVKLHQEKE